MTQNLKFSKLLSQLDNKEFIYELLVNSELLIFAQKKDCTFCGFATCKLVKKKF